MTGFVARFDTWEDFCEASTRDQLEEIEAAAKYVIHQPGFGLGYVYPHHDRALYVRDGKPDCLAGRILHLLGLPVETLERYEDEHVEEILRSQGLTTVIPIAALVAMQAIQDPLASATEIVVGTQGTWGHALRVLYALSTMVRVQ